MRVNEVAAAIHRDMCDDERNGYSWEERHGQAGHPKTLVIDGREYTYDLGDRDCSSSFIEAWRLAIQYTAYAGALDGATYTGNIRQVFLASGLFEEWDTAGTTAQVGDGYLNDESHVAMCQSVEPDLLSEFSWGDNGAYGNVRGDQSGWESHVCGFYEYPWDVTMHYNGRADGTEPAASAPPKGRGPAAPRYRVFRDGRWRRWRRDGKVAGKRGSAIWDVDFRGLGPGGWFQLTLEGGEVLPRNSHNGARAKRVIGVTVYYATADPASTGYWRAEYRARVLGGGWLKREYDDEDGGAGDDSHPLDGFWLRLAR